MNTIKRFRMLALATFSLLNTKQRMFVSQNGRILNANDKVRIDSSSDQLAEHENITENLANIFSRSKDKVDKRLSKLFKIKNDQKLPYTIKAPREQPDAVQALSRFVSQP